MMWLQTLMEVMTALVQTYGYLGIFISVAITSATIILPIPGYVTVLFAGPFLNPYIVALVAGLGAAIGEITSYLLHFWHSLQDDFLPFLLEAFGI